MSDSLRLLEALLFASPDPLTQEELIERLPEGTDILALIAELQTYYTGRGVELVKRDTAYAFRTAPDLAPHLCFTKIKHKAPTRAAMETLAIIAYHQPITRAEIESIRGVSTHRGTLDILMEAGWIRTGRRRMDALGQPMTWITTPVFLDYFGLSSLEDLPDLQDLKSAGLLDRSSVDMFSTVPPKEEK